MSRIRTVVVLGGGSAGLLAALTLKRKLPELSVEVVFSSKIGVIGVGEGTVPYVPGHLHGYLGLDEHGWCWRIDHPDRIHRGYVFSSVHVTDDEAVDAYRQMAPKAANPRIVRFRSGQYHHTWLGNVIAVGNAGGFVEPLEATARSG